MAETTPKTVAPKTVRPIEQVTAMMASAGWKEQLRMALPKHVDQDKFTRVALTAINNNPALLDPETDRNSLYSACLVAAQEGLVPDGREAALVMFGRKVQYMAMVAGVLKKIRNSGELSSITSQVVYEKDKFRYWVDSNGEHLEHEPNVLSPGRGSEIGVYALAKLKDGSVYIEVMSTEQIGAIRNIAKTKNVWDGPFKHEMWRKSAIRRLAKRLPSSTDLDHFIEKEDEDIDPTPKPVVEAPSAEPKKSRLDQVIDTKFSEPEPAPTASAQPETPASAVPI